MSLECVTAGASIKGCFLCLNAHLWVCGATKKGRPGLSHACVRLHTCFSLGQGVWWQKIRGSFLGRLSCSTWPPALLLHLGQTRDLGLLWLCGSFPVCLWPLGRQGRACPGASLCSDSLSPGIVFGSAHVGHLLSQCVSGGARCCLLTLCWQGCPSEAGELMGCWGEDLKLWEDPGRKGGERWKMGNGCQDEQC